MNDNNVVYLDESSESNEAHLEYFKNRLVIEKLISNFKNNSEVIAYKIDLQKIWIYIKNENGYSKWYCYKDVYLKNETAFSDGRHYIVQANLSKDWVLL